MTLSRRLVISESLLFVFGCTRDARYCTSFVSYTILNPDLSFHHVSISSDQFLHYEVVMVLLTAFDVLHPLSRDSNHYSAPT